MTEEVPTPKPTIRARVKTKFRKTQEEMVVESVKEHVKTYKSYYILGASVVGTAGITALIMRGIASSRPNGLGIVAEASQGGNVAVLGKKAVMSNVSFISSNRQGPPSWVIRCIDTGAIYTSQRAASLDMNIPQSEISQQLTGGRDTARGRTFERICLAG